MSAAKPSVDAMQKELKAKDALLQEQETTIDHQRTEIMDLKARMAQKRTAARQGTSRGR